MENSDYEKTGAMKSMLGLYAFALGGCQMTKQKSKPKTQMTKQKSKPKTQKQMKAISSNAMLPAVIAPIDARNEKGRLRLREDNTSTENYWLLLNDGHITLANQRSGENMVWWAQIPRKEWDKIVKWYMKPQKVMGNNCR